MSRTPNQVRLSLALPACGGTALGNAENRWLWRRCFAPEATAGMLQARLRRNP